MGLLGITAVLVLMFGYCYGSCYIIANDPDATNCRTKNGTILQSGEKLRLTDECTDCSCVGNILSCCGYGFYSGHMHVVGCKVIVGEDGCSAKVVDILDETKPCSHRG